MSAVYSGDITRDTVAAAYGIQYDRAIKISRERVPAPALARVPSTSTLVFRLVSNDDPCPGSSARMHVHACTDAHTRHARTSRGELSAVQSICATNHDHPMRYRDRWRVYSLPTHCTEIKFYPRWRTRPANRRLLRNASGVTDVSIVF